MEIERILYPVTALGPGRRIAIWTIGCNMFCSNCISPELWARRPDKKIKLPRLISLIREVADNNPVDGITISGGEPFLQFDALHQLIFELHHDIKDILLYTGFTLEELYEMYQITRLEKLTSQIAVLIDGKYIDEDNDGLSPLRGSINQRIHYFNRAVKPHYEEYMSDTNRQVQNIYYESSLISVGIHQRRS